MVHDEIKAVRAYVAALECLFYTIKLSRLNKSILGIRINPAVWLVKGRM